MRATAGQVLEGILRAAAGLDPARSVDEVVGRLAAEAGIPVTWELGDAQATLSWFAGMKQELEVEYLMWTIERITTHTCMTVSWNATERGNRASTSCSTRPAAPSSLSVAPTSSGTILTRLIEVELEVERRA